MSTKNLVKAGASRLSKAADSKVDPAVPASLQEETNLQGGTKQAETKPELVPPGFDVGTLTDLSPEEQFRTLDAAYASSEHAEFESIAAAKMRGTIQRGTVLKALVDEDRFKAGGYSNISEYAKKLGINRQYLYGLITDAENLLAIKPLIEAAGHPLVATHAAILSPIFQEKGQQEAEAVLALAKESGKLTAASLADAARKLGYLPAIPAQNQAPARLPVADTLSFVDAVYKAVAPANVKALVDQDPEQALKLMDDAAAELRKIERRINEGRKLARQALPQSQEVLITEEGKAPGSV